MLSADDQTLIHWRADALQAMLNECQRFAEENLYVYNVQKSEVCWHSDSQLTDLLLDGQSLRAVEETFATRSDRLSWARRSREAARVPC